MPITQRHSGSVGPLIAGFVILLCSAAAAILLASEQSRAGGWIRHTFEVQTDLFNALTLVTNAETGQRGFLLTGRDRYLAPYTASRTEMPAAMQKLAADTNDDTKQKPLRGRLNNLVAIKLQELQQAIDLRRRGSPHRALALVNNDSGQQAMDGIRKVVQQMQAEEVELLKRRAANYRLFNQLSQWVLFATPVLLLGLGLFAVFDNRRRYRELQDAYVRLNEAATERENAEARLAQLQKMEAIGQLTGGIAHDFNNMLAIIIGSLDMARRRLSRSPDEAALKYIDSAADGARRAATLTSRLLAFSRQHPLEPRVLEVNKLISNMSELLHRTIGEAITVETVLAARLWKVRADPSQLENVVLNLAVNARDAMPNGGKLTIETANSELDDRYVAQQPDLEAGQYVLISITDNGSGMSPEILKRAFDPFYTTKEVGKGTGLGLSQVLGFVKQSGGHVAIYSELDAGTTVKIYLPRNTDALDESTELEEVAQPPSGAPDEVILVVEDEDAVRRVTVDNLRELGYTVFHASSGEDALDQLSRKPGIGLLLTDVVMPQMNGRQLADRALTINSNLKVVYATGYTRNAIVHNGVVDAGTALLTKPFTLAQLATKVRQALDSW